MKRELNLKPVFTEIHVRNIDSDLWKQLKIVAADLDLKVYEALQDAIRQYVRGKI